MAQLTLREYLQSTEDAISSGRINDAFTACEHMLLQYPEALEGRRLLGEVYLAQGHLDQARQEFDWVLINDPENVIAYCDRALISERQADYDTALDCYQQAYELSRGNTQIRQEFNQISQKVGQQGFIFSRAGLARLYMRGDLLTEAVQEWETVLTSAPERLDARIGLLETYWREGFYDSVEQLATQILADVPGCLKALLLLAHVTYKKYVQQSRELLRRAEALDPEYILAQELFSDYLASHVDDPFVMYLQQQIAMHPSIIQPVAAAQPADNVNVAAATSNPGLFSSPERLEEWSTLGTFPEAEQTFHQPQEPGVWSASSSNGVPHVDAIAPTNRIDTALEQQETTDEGASTPISEQATMAQPLWLDAYPPMEPTTSREVDEDESSSGFMVPWEMETQVQPLPKPPAWLEMLTKGEKPQPAAPIPAANPPVAEPAPQFPLQARQSSATSEVRHAPPPADARAQDEDSFTFGPEWLRSLGAEMLEPSSLETMEPFAEAQPVIATSEEELRTQAASTEEDTTSEPPALTGMESSPPLNEPLVDQHLEQEIAGASQLSTLAESVAMDEWPVAEPEKTAQLTEPVAPPPWETTPDTQPGEQTGSEVDDAPINTLEAIENDLRAQGFLPVDLSSISALIQEPSGAEDQTSPTTAEHEDPPYLNQPDAASLVTEMGEDAQVDMEAASPFAMWTSQVSSFTEFEETELVNADAEAPEHLAGLEQEPARSAEPTIFAADASIAANSAEEAVTLTPPPAPALQPAEEPTLVEMPAVEATEQASRRDEIALETTMKRPLAGLHAIQPSQQAQHFNQRAQEVAKSGQGSVHYRERLLKGYQYQLAGLYDEAMQEYRVVMRNAPDLLGEVVSNMRALLKIAPKYVPGYRILGDAYMRQGEYLQAMEAYNKALAMSKKGRQ